MRATTNGISAFAGDFAFQFASVSTSFSPNFLAVAIAQNRLEHDPNTDGQPRNSADFLFFQGRQ